MLRKITRPTYIRYIVYGIFLLVVMFFFVEHNELIKQCTKNINQDRIEKFFTSPNKFRHADLPQNDDPVKRSPPGPEDSVLGTNQNNRRALQLASGYGKNNMNLIPIPGEHYYSMSHGSNGRYDFEISGHVADRINAVRQFYIPITAKHVSLMSGDHELMTWTESQLENQPKKNMNGKPVIIIKPTKETPMPIVANGQTGTLYLLIEMNDNVYPSFIGADVGQYRMDNMSFKNGDDFYYTDSFFKNGRFYAGTI